MQLLVRPPELSPAASGGSSGGDRESKLVRVTLCGGRHLWIPGNWQVQTEPQSRGKGQICYTPHESPPAGSSQKCVQSAGPANDEIDQAHQIAAEIAELNLLAKQARKERRSEEAKRRVARSSEGCIVESEGDRQQPAVQQGAPFDQPDEDVAPEASRSRPSGRSGQQGKSRPTPPRAAGAEDYHEFLWRRYRRFLELDDHSPERSKEKERSHCEARPAPRGKANRGRSAISLEELIQADLRRATNFQMDPSREMVPAAAPRARDRPGWDADEVGAWR